MCNYSKSVNDKYTDNKKIARYKMLHTKCSMPVGGIFYFTKGVELFLKLIFIFSPNFIKFYLFVPQINKFVD